jgi:protein-L-isoaspartate(D-aspartate) O-methyltransferase
MRAVPRHRFVPHVTLADAYDDRAIPLLAHGTATTSSLSQPTMIAQMLELLQVQPGMCVIEIGTGSGYQAALLAELVGPTGTVMTIERDADLAARARRVLESLSYTHVIVRAGDGTRDLPANVRADRMIVAACARDLPAAWWAALESGGRLVLPLDLGPLGERCHAFTYDGRLMRADGPGIPCAFVPLVTASPASSEDDELYFPSGTRTIPARSHGATAKSIVAMPRNAADRSILERADLVVARPETLFAVTLA